MVAVYSECMGSNMFDRFWTLLGFNSRWIDDGRVGLGKMLCYINGINGLKSNTVWICMHVQQPTLWPLTLPNVWDNNNNNKSSQNNNRYSYAWLHTQSLNLFA